MTQLTVQNQLPANIPVSQQAFVVLRVGHKSIKDLEPNVVKRACVDILTRASFDMGSPMADNDKVLQFQTEALYSEMKGKLNTLTIPEVQEAFNRGIRGEAGQFFGLCPRTYHQFLKYFFELPERSESWVNYLDEQEGKKKPRKIEFSQDQLKTHCRNAFSDYRTTGGMPFSPHATYDTLKELLGLKTLIPVEKWEQVKRDAKHNLIQLTKSKAGNKNKASELIKKLEYTEGSQYEFECKKIGLRIYFEQLIAENKELEF
jgi:hypothetical protein